VGEFRAKVCRWGIPLLFGQLCGSPCVDGRCKDKTERRNVKNECEEREEEEAQEVNNEASMQFWNSVQCGAQTHTEEAGMKEGELVSCAFIIQW
jgi:hypothetical protein